MVANNLYDEFISPSGSHEDILKEIQNEQKKGSLHILYQKYLSTTNESSNLILPYYDEYSSQLRELIIINNPKDAERLAAKHIKKTPYLKSFVYDSIISTTDVDEWKNQRRHYQPAFSVKEKLEKLIPISNKRAKECIFTLGNINTNCDGEYINIYEFFLNETMAQLQLAMFGFTEKFQNKTNSKIRAAFNGDNIEYGREFVHSLLDEIQTVKGPLSEAMKTRKNATKRETFGNALIFPFAGHDTTANTLTWLIYEIGKNKEIYKKLQTEIDNFWKEQDNPNIITYNDLKRLKYMTRCIMETLRLWTPIPNGTSRELIEDDFIIGKIGQKVKVPKGTYIQIPNWTRHRSRELWGCDVNSFNPDRDFKDEEIYDDLGLASYNPNSERFSPFTYGPRDCIGKNFSQIEMRIILLHLLKNFEFTIPLCQVNTYTMDTISINHVTLGPRNINNTNLTEKVYGMYVSVIPRMMESKL